MQEGEETPLPPIILRNLNDKLYEKRKNGALAVEELVKQMRVTNRWESLKKMIQYITDVLIYSSNPNSKKGGLIALAAIAIGLAKVLSFSFPKYNFAIKII